MNDFLFDPERSSTEQPSVPVLPRKITADGRVIDDFAAAPQPAAAPPQKKQRSGLWLTLTVMAICVSLTLSVFAIAEARRGTVEPATVYGITQSNTPLTNVRDNVTEGDVMTTQEIIAKVNPSTVTVLVNVYDKSTGQSGSGFGTGVVFSENGYILTNAHVVEDAVKVTVRDNNGTEYPATVIGYDTPSDVAVIKAEASGMIPAEFGKSSSLIPGDKVIAIGTPYEQSLSNTATEGIVSAVRDKIKFPELGYTLNVIQHSAPINFGNSGGPLINEYGQVIGINSIKISGTYENIGFALLIDEVLPLAEELMQNGKIAHPAIGITGYTYEDNGLCGTYVYTVIENGPAAKAGLQVNDIIIEADGHKVETIDELKEIINAHKIGDTLNIKYFRNGTVSELKIVLEDLG